MSLVHDALIGHERQQGKWVEMGELISDDVLDAFAVVGPPDDIPKLVLGRFGDVIDRFSFYTPYAISPEQLDGLMTGFKQG